MALTQSEYAAYRKAKGLRGGTKQAVGKAVKSGRITLGEDGKLDPAVADAQWTANTHGSVPAPKAQGPDPYHEARTEVVQLRAKTARLAYERSRGELVPLVDVQAAWRRELTRVRRRLLAAPARLCTQLASEVDEASVRTLLEAELRDILATLDVDTPPTK